MAAKPRVLVIDDEPLLGQTIRLGLEGSLDVELETSGQRGLERALSDDFDLVLCDLSLPDTNGISIYEQLREKRPEMVEGFVVMTGGAATEEMGHFLDQYEGHLLNKPFTLRELESLALSLLR